ncbi:L serine dehydratase:l threonine deaminase [Fasciolopsis buskii]|uniref:L-serine ammonia-lyase n=1 Tax=Fasciolopsis buskii TaxID=27845 RepID=A0A8E0RPP7_9TREM|nr:L serine dehydratase:l threonine deaminase [Fasciolopsis buski]
MHAGGCISSNLSDVFPSLPIQDTIPCGQILNVNTLSGVDVASRLKYLGLNVPSHNANTAGVFFNEDRSRTNLIINYLPQSYDQNDLQRLFERVGPIRQCKLIRDKNTGASLCYGFVDFVNPQHAALAIQTYHGYETEQKRLRVAYASSGGRRIAPGTRLFGVYFSPGHRVASFPGSVPNGLGSEITNENIIGWEVFVVGIPLEWTEPDLLRLFNNFGNVVLIRLLAPQMSESPPSHKPRLSSPVLNGASSDLSADSTDGSRITTTASIIFEDKSRQSPALVPSRLPNGQPAVDPLTESEALTNLLNRKALSASNCLPSALSKALDTNCLTASNDLPSTAPFAVPPRAIIRNKEQENTKSDASLRSLQQNHGTWSYQNHRSVLSTLPEAARGTDGLTQTILSGVQKRLAAKTPLLPSPVLTNIVSQRGCQAQVWLKLENVQPTGSFKIRGMENVCRKWASCGVTHVVCPSGGNAAIAAACATRAYGISCTIVMPESADSGMRRRLLLETPDAKVVIHGSDWLETHQRAEQMVSELQMNHPGESIRLLHPYDQSELWEGYESIIDELGPDLGQPDVIIVSVGGGGLLAGIIQVSFDDDHGMLVEPACGASLSVLYSGMVGRLQMEGRIPRPANVVVVIGGGRNVSLRQLSEWESQTNSFGPLQQVSTSFLPSMTSPYLADTSPHSVSSDMSTKSNLFAPHLSTDPDETLKCGTSTPSTPRPVCTILSRPQITTESMDAHGPAAEADRETNAEGPGTLNPHDLVNFSKLLATSETEGDDGALHE